MLKNGFLTFCCAFIPGAGQMYQGYMKRGLSLILTACLIGMVSSLLNPVMLLLLGKCGCIADYPVEKRLQYYPTIH